MIRAALSFLSFVSVVAFPWPLTALLAVVCALYVPLVPLAVGIFADALYYVPQAPSPPFFAIFGAALSAFGFFVRGRLKASIIR